MSKLAKVLTEVAVGTGLVLLDVFAPEIGIPVTVATILGSAGAGLVIGGIGTALTPDPVVGSGIATRNPVTPWNVVYGRAKVGGDIVYIGTFGDSDKYLDLVICLACHPCQSVDALLFDNQRVLLNSNGDSFTPSNNSIVLTSISRSNDVVTYVTTSPMTEIQDGDQVQIHNVAGDLTLNGTFPVQVINSTTFQYICGGDPTTITNSGYAKTTFPDYRGKVHMEVLLGDHVQTFPGMLYGTPDDGDTSSLVINQNNPWTANHLLLGRTAVFIRLHYNDEVFTAGIPNISFRVHGKKDIYDPRAASVVARPTTLLNGWGSNAHVGAYEQGVDQGFNFGLGGSVVPYANPQFAYNGDGTTSASSVLQHTHTYAGCVWSFPASTATGTLYLNILSEIPADGTRGLYINTRSAGLWYSLDGGNSWTQIYNSPSHAKGWDSVTLPANQDLSKVQVMAFNDSHDDMCHFVYDIQISTSASGALAYAYTENAALCIADFLANQTWGFKAKYGSEIPDADLIAAANICDEAVPLASGATEPRYTCDGSFQLSARRGEILTNLLTSCGGRLTFTNGEYRIYPAAWTGPSLTIGPSAVTSATLTVWASWVPGGGDGIGQPAIDVVFGEVQMAETDQSPIRASLDTSGLGSTPAAITYSLDQANFASIGEMSVVAYVVGTVYGSDTPPATLCIYDCSIAVSYYDGSTQTIRPTYTNTAQGNAGGIFGTGISGQVANPDNALDGDSNSPVTCATITRSNFNGFASAGYLQLTQFPFGNGIPDLTPPGMHLSDLALAHAAGPFEWRPTNSISNQYNAVKGTYISPFNGWIAGDFPPYAQDAKHGYTNGPGAYSNDANLAWDGGDRRYLELSLPFTISASTAQRLAKIALLRSRWAGTGTFVFDLAMYQTTVLDVISMNLPILGWRSKLLEVSSHRFTNRKGENDVTILGTELDLRETDPSIYEWNPTEELTAQGYVQATLPNPNEVTAPTSVTLTSGPTVSVIGADGVARSRILVSWTVPADGFVTEGGHYDVQYKNVNDSTWTALPSIDGTQTQMYINGVTDGQQYLVQVRSVNVSGAPSSWVQAGPVTVSGTPTSLALTSISTSGSTSGQTITNVNGTWTPTTLPSPLILQTNGTNNGSQSKLNLVAGSNIALHDDGSGDVTITGSSPFTPGGDLSGTNTSQTVIGLQGKSISTTVPTDGQILTFVSADNKWEAKTPTAASSSGTWIEEIPSGTLNGSNKIFTLSNAPLADSLTVFLNVVQGETDFTLSGNTLTFAVAPKARDAGWFLARYQH